MIIDAESMLSDFDQHRRRRLLPGRASICQNLVHFGGPENTSVIVDVVDMMIRHMHLFENVNVKELFLDFIVKWRRHSL